MRKLNDKDLEDFLEHVDSCEECYEELEIYYTVHYTIARLDEDEADQVYNVKKALQNRLEESRFLYDAAGYEHRLCLCTRKGRHQIRTDHPQLRHILRKQSCGQLHL